MRRTSAALLTLLAFLSTLALVWSGGVAREPASRSLPAQAADPAAPAPLPAATTEAEGPTRDLFVFGEAAEARRSDEHLAQPSATSWTLATAATPTPEPTPAPRARLVGFLRTAAGPSAVLALDGAVEIARVREARRGYRLLALDEETATVRLETPEGEELELSLATPGAEAAAESDAPTRP